MVVGPAPSTNGSFLEPANGPSPLKGQFPFTWVNFLKPAVAMEPAPLNDGSFLEPANGPSPLKGPPPLTDVNFDIVGPESGEAKGELTEVCSAVDNEGGAGKSKVVGAEFIAGIVMTFRERIVAVEDSWSKIEE